MYESTSVSSASAFSMEGMPAGQQLPTFNVDCIGRVMLPSSGAPNSLPELFQGRPIVLLHGLPKFLHDFSFCLQTAWAAASNHQLPLESHKPTRLNRAPP